LFKERKKWNDKLEEGILERRVTRRQAAKFKCPVCFEGEMGMLSVCIMMSLGRGEWTGEFMQ
jgi:hypothetical protein